MTNMNIFGLFKSLCVMSSCINEKLKVIYTGMLINSSKINKLNQ